MMMMTTTRPRFPADHLTSSLLAEARCWKLSSADEILCLAGDFNHGFGQRDWMAGTAENAGLENGENI